MKLTLTALLLCLLLLLGSCAAKPPAEPALATLGDDIAITVPDFSFFYFQQRLQLEQQMAMYGMTDMTTYWSEMEGDVTRARAMADQSLEYLKLYFVLYRDALAQKVALTPEEEATIEDGVTSMLASINGDEQLFTDMFHITVAQLRETQRKVMLIQKHIDSIYETIEVSDADVMAYYEENKAANELVTVRHVLISCDDTMTAEVQAAALAKAEDILAQLEAGGDIAALAAEHSEDPGSKDIGGIYTFGRGEMVPEFETWAFDAAFGDVGNVKTSYGYHVMQKLESDLPEQEKAILEKVRPAVETLRFDEICAEQIALAQSPDWVLDEAKMAEVIG